MSVCLRETNTKNTYDKMRGRNYVAPNTRILKVSFGRLKPTCDIRSFSMDKKEAEKKITLEQERKAENTT